MSTYAVMALKEANEIMTEAHAHAKKCNAVYLRDRMVRGSARDHTEMRRHGSHTIRLRPMQAGLNQIMKEQ